MSISKFLLQQSKDPRHLLRLSDQFANLQSLVYIIYCLALNVCFVVLAYRFMIEKHHAVLISGRTSFLERYQFFLNES